MNRHVVMQVGWRFRHVFFFFFFFFKVICVHCQQGFELDRNTIRIEDVEDKLYRGLYIYHALFYGRSDRDSVFSRTSFVVLTMLILILSQFAAEYTCITWWMVSLLWQACALTSVAAQWHIFDWQCFKHNVGLQEVYVPVRYVSLGSVFSCSVNVGKIG